MLNDREKLIELIGYGKKKCGESLTCRECEYDYGGANCIDQMTADHLIANGVTVREKGEWIDRYGGKYANPLFECSVCKEKALYKFEVDVLGKEYEVQALSDICPHCGADMRGEEHEGD